jgi:MscS family membrane protein
LHLEFAMVFGLEAYVMNPYLRALVILVIVFIVLRVVMFVIEKIILRTTLKTKTDIDDKFVSKASKPVTVLILLIGLRIALEELPLSEGVLSITGDIIFSLIIVALAFVVYYFVDIVLFFVLKKTMKGESSSVKQSLTSLVHGIMQVIFIALALLYILEVWGVEIGPFLAGLGVAGIAVALALQPALQNIFSGVSVILDKSVKVGDLIYFDAETKGKVLKVGLRSTKILTFDNELVIIPNSKVADSRIQNIGEPDPKARAVIPFGVAYGSDIENVKKIVMSEIKKVDHFINDPEPVVRFLEMADSSLNFKAFFYVDSFENRYGAIDEANTKIYNALNKNGISIPFPQMDVHMKDSKKK